LRSRRLSFFATFALTIAAALSPGAAVFVRPAHACSLMAVDSPVRLVPEAELIVIGEVTAVDGAGATLRPEAFLKGPLSGKDIRLERDSSGCPTAGLETGARALVFVFDADAPRYPYVNEAYLLKDGHARMEGSAELSEVEVVSAIRAVTGQYAVPAESESEGAGIDWRNTILPLGAALGVIFVIGLALMRVWHRIDPS